MFIIYLTIYWSYIHHIFIHIFIIIFINIFIIVFINIFINISHIFIILFINLFIIFIKYSSSINPLFRCLWLIVTDGTFIIAKLVCCDHNFFVEMASIIRNTIYNWTTLYLVQRGVLSKVVSAKSWVLEVPWGTKSAWSFLIDWLVYKIKKTYHAKKLL